MARGHTRTIKAGRLGKELEAIRKGYSLDIAQVAADIDVSEATLRRIEQGLHKVDPTVWERLFERYHLTHERQQELLDLAAEAFRSGWWLEYGDVLHGPFAVMEDEADRLCSFQSQVVPGLLQTDPYARALFESGLAAPDTWDTQTQEKRVLARRTRRAILDRPDPPLLHAVMSEAVLRQQVGGAETMSGQLAHLLSIGKRENVTLQVIPFRSGAHAGLAGPFIIFEFPHDGDDDVVHTENLGGSSYSQAAGAVRRFRLAWGSVVDAALSPQESIAMIAELTTER